MAAIRGVDGGGELDVQFGGLVDSDDGIPQRVVQYVTSMQSPIAGEVQMEADDLDSRQAVGKQNPTIVPDTSWRSRLCSCPIAHDSDG